MKNIVAFVGSQSDDSNTYRIAKLLLDAVRNKTCDISYTIIQSKNINIKRCKGCNTCFLKCKCPLDSIDSMKYIKELFIAADFLILGSPVYAHNVSGDMKILIDRLSYWMHLMTLAGKPGMTLTTTASNGNEYVTVYLHKIMNYFGVKVVGNIVFSMFNKYGRKNDEDFNDEIQKYAGVIYEYLTGEKEIVSDNVLDKIFFTLKKIMQSREIYSGTDNNAEYEYWLKNGYLDCNSFEDVLNRRKKN